MKLNKEGKNALRKKIEELLKNVPDGQRIHLDKDLLEDLLFDKSIEEISINFEEHAGKKVPVKYITWSGDFLSKIDLSEVSFDDVMWYVGYPAEDYFENSTYKYSENYKIDLSNTNAKIDFSKSFTSKYLNELIIDNCDFSNVDLSNNQLQQQSSFSNCNFSKTKLYINLESDRFRMWNCNLSGLYFFNYHVFEHFFVDGNKYGKRSFACECDLSDTNLQVFTTEIDEEILKAYKQFQQNPLLDEPTRSELWKKIEPYIDDIRLREYLGKQIKKGLLNGCSVNGHIIRNPEQQAEIAKELMIEYEQYRDNLIDSVESSIEEQISRMKK